METQIMECIIAVKTLQARGDMVLQDFCNQRCGVNGNCTRSIASKALHRIGCCPDAWQSGMSSVLLPRHLLFNIDLPGLSTINTGFFGGEESANILSFTYLSFTVVHVPNMGSCLKQEL